MAKRDRRRYRSLVPIAMDPPIVAFEDDDRDYLFWTHRNPRGYVVNCARQPTSDYLVLHWADCWTINGTQSRWTTGDYAKVCSPTLAPLEEWAQTLGGDLWKCEKCWAP